MKNSEIFDTILEEVCQEFEVSVDTALNDFKLSAAVDARSMAVHYMKSTGLSNDDIALVVLRKQAHDMSLVPTQEQIKNKAKSVSKMGQRYYTRKKQANSHAYELHEKEIRTFCYKKYGELWEPWMKELKYK